MAANGFSRKPRAQQRGAVLAVNMTPAQQRAQDATVAILRRYCDEAEAYLRARADSARDASLDALCGCGIVERDCRCPLRAKR